ncbi:MAG: class I SAM-dependent methyltransferase [Ignavibacteriales bacterium]|nr:class I SAM-dependent methyltransferase [Ignavibacteriales bacterium]
MARMIETTSESNVVGFYDALAPDYDAMTGFPKRFIQEKPFFHFLVERYKITTALDAGCGTGFHALLLSQLGVNVTAVDISKEMLQRVAMHAKELVLNIELIESSFQNLPSIVKRKFDAVFSLGNSIAHLLSDKELRLAFGGFAGLLNPQGILFLQNLNYDRLLNSHEKVQNVKESNGKTFVRFYDYNEKDVAFNILTMEEINGSVTQRLKTVHLRPLLADELVSFLQEAGFTDIRLFGSISMEQFQKETSKDLVILAKRNDT